MFQDVLKIILINKDTKIKANAICDTGATTAVIHEEIAKTLGLKIRDETDMTILPDGTKVAAKKTNLEVYDVQREKKTKIEATVMKNVKHDIFLGEKDLIKMKILDKEYKKKPKNSKTSKIDLNKYLMILSVLMIFSTACATDGKYDLKDYEKANEEIENTRTFLKYGEYPRT